MQIDPSTGLRRELSRTLRMSSLIIIDHILNYADQLLQFNMAKVVVIGGGVAGLTAAFTLKQMGNQWYEPQGKPCFWQGLAHAN